jgi:hypothetical protein
MVAFQVSYPLTTDKSGSSSEPFVAGDVQDAGVSFCTVETGVDLWVTPVTTTINPSYYVSVTITPDGEVGTWSPASLAFNLRRRESGTVALQARSSHNGYAAAVGTTVSTSNLTATPFTVNLSSIGTVSGPLTLRMLVSHSGSGRSLGLGSVVLSGTYVAASPPQVVSPVGIASGEAFGEPVLVIVQPVELFPVGIPSGEAFGTPEVQHGAPVAVSPYPTGQDVAGFLGVTDDAHLVAMAEVHVGVITHFARVYTRGNGFYVEGVVPEVASVVLAATGRLVANPEQINITVGTMRRDGSFKGWSLAEQRVLNEYRGTAR